MKNPTTRLDPIWGKMYHDLESGRERTKILLHENDYLVRAIRQLVKALATLKKKSHDEEHDFLRTEDAIANGEDLESLFCEVTGLSGDFLKLPMVQMLPKMMTVNSDGSKLVVAARILIAMSHSSGSNSPEIEVARQLIEKSKELSVDPEVERIRKDCLELLNRADA